MTRLLWQFLVVAVLGGIAIWLANRPGDFVLEWQGYEVAAPFSLFVGAVVVLVLVLFALIHLLDRYVFGSGSVREFLGRRREEKGLAAIRHGLIAAAVGDRQAAEKNAKTAARLLPGQPMALLLEAQSANLTGNAAAAERAYAAMVDNDETRLLGLRGLFSEALARGDMSAALRHAQRAFDLAPRTRWAFDAVFRLQSDEENWADAKTTLDRSMRARLLDRDEGRRRRGVLMTAEAAQMVAEAGDLDEAAQKERENKAAALAEEALVYARGFVPAGVLAARLLAKDGRGRRAARLIEDLWSEAPHPDLAEIYDGLEDGEPVALKAERMRRLAARNPDHIESWLIDARMAVAQRDWAEARRLLTPLVERSPSARVCALMAELEQGEHGDTVAAQSWIARAVRAPREGQWRCGECGHAPAAWSANCPSCGSFDSIGWSDQAVALIARSEIREGEDEAARSGDKSGEEAPVGTKALVEHEPGEAVAAFAKRFTGAGAAAADQAAQSASSRAATAPRSDVGGTGKTGGATGGEDEDLILPPSPDDPGPRRDDRRDSEEEMRW